MASVIFDKSFSIQAMHGTLQRNRDGSRVVVRTNSRTGRMTMMLLKPYRRTTPVSDAEIAGRNRFSQISREVAKRVKAGDRRLKSLIWAEVKAQLSDNATE